MRASHDLSRVSTSFDEHNLVPNAGLLPAAVLAQRIDLSGLVDGRVHLAKHGANSGAKAVVAAGAQVVQRPPAGHVRPDRAGPDAFTLIGDGQQSIYPGGYSLSELGISLAGRGAMRLVG